MNYKYLTTVVLAFSVFITACSDSEEEDKIAAKEVADNFIEALEDGDIRKAKKYCDKDTRDLILQYEEGFVDLFKRQKFKLKEPKITSGKKAKISAKGRTINIVFRLVKDDSEWKISMEDVEDWEGSDNTDGGDRTINQSEANQAEGTANAEATESAGEYGEAKDEAQFLCRNGESIPYRWYNDGGCDCSDCSDEPEREAPAAQDGRAYDYGYEEPAIQADETYESAMREYNRAMREYNEQYESAMREYNEAFEEERSQVIFYCWDGREIPMSYVNDGDCDCDNCEDEDE